MKRVRIALTLTVCFASAGFAQTPTITAVLDAGAYTPTIAQGSVFVVKGTNLASSNATSNLPYGTTLNGVKITFTPSAGGSGVSANMVYTFSQGTTTQLAAVLPSTLATGAYNMVVTSGTAASAPFSVNVVSNKFGIMTQPGTGTGRALVQNVVSQTQYDLNGYTTGPVSGANFSRSPAKAGEYLVIWGTGLGPAAGFDAGAPASGLNFLSTQNLDVKVIVGTTELTPSYAGRSNLFPGLDNISVQLPSSIITGCFLNLQVRVAGLTSNIGTIAIAAHAQDSSCTDPQYSQTVLGNLDAGGSTTVGVFSIYSESSKVTVLGQTSASTFQFVGGGFSRYTADQLFSVTQMTQEASILPTGSCYVYRTTVGLSNTPGNTGTTTGSSTGTPPIPLDAGVITLNGPNVPNQQLTETSGTYVLPLTSTSAQSTPVLTAGTYTLTGKGGADIGPFTASIQLNPLTVAPDLPTTVVRSQDLHIGWTGGGTSIVGISGTAEVLISGTPQNNPVYDLGEFECLTTADKGSFTVTSGVLGQMPAAPASAVAAGTASTSLEVFSTVGLDGRSGTFTAPLTKGGNIDYGYLYTSSGSSVSPAYQ